MIVFILIFLLVLLFPFFFPGYYGTELIMSFLPYLIGMVLFFVIFSFVYFKKNIKIGSSHRYFRGIAFLVGCVIFFIRSKQFNRFYTPQVLQESSSGKYLQVLFANIHKDNTHYDELQQIIETNDPDVLMFVEFAHHHYDYLKEFLKTHYPYTNNISRSTTFVGSMVFSKYPIDNKADDFPQGAWRYGYFSLKYQGQDIYFYLIHTSSPDSYAHFLMRNEQLSTFVKDFQKHESERIHKNIVAVGDFNITPRSSYYTILDKAFSGYMENDTRTLPFLFTWKFKLLPFMKAHIDHIRSTKSVQVQDLHAINIPGSDHKGFVFTIKID